MRAPHTEPAMRSVVGSQAGDAADCLDRLRAAVADLQHGARAVGRPEHDRLRIGFCLLYTSDAADEMD